MKKILLFLGLLLLVLTSLSPTLSNVADAQDDDDEDDRCSLFVDGATIQDQPTYDSKRVSIPATGDVLAIGKEGQWYTVIGYYRDVFIFGYMHEYGAYRTEGNCDDFPEQPFIEDDIVVGRVSVLDCSSESNECVQYEFESEELENILTTQCVELDGEEFGSGCGVQVEQELVPCSTEAVPTADQLVNISCGDIEFTAPADNVIISSDFSIVLDYGSMVVMITRQDINLACPFNCTVSDSSVEVDGETYLLEFLQAVEAVGEDVVFSYLEE